MNRAILSVALVSILGSCTVDVPEPADGLFACEKDDDCSGDWSCDTRVRRCVDPNNPPGNPCDTQPCNPGERCIRDDTQPDGYGCSACGNDRLDGDEECDGPEPAGESCATKDLGIGTLGCNPDTCSWDTSNCWVPPGGWYGPGKGGQPAETASGGLASNPDIAIDGHGRPIVVYTQLDTGATVVVHASRFEGSERQFENLNAGDPLSDPSSGSLRPRVAVAPDNRIGVVYRQGLAANAEIHFRQFLGDSWGSVVAFGGCPATLDCLHFDLAYNTDSDAFVVVWMTDGRVHAVEINAQNGVTGLADVSEEDGAYHDGPALSTDWSTGEAIVAWQVDDGSAQAIYVKRWNPANSSWDAVSSGSASGGGVSAWGENQWPSLARDGSGPLALTWQHSAVGQTDGALRILDGGAWNDMGGAGNPALDARPYIGFLNVAMAGQEPVLVWQDGSSAASSAGNVAVTFWRYNAWREGLAQDAALGAIFINESDMGSGQCRVATGPNGLGGRHMCVSWSEKNHVVDATYDRVMVRCHVLP